MLILVEKLQSDLNLKRVSESYLTPRRWKPPSVPLRREWVPVLFPRQWNPNLGISLGYKD